MKIFESIGYFSSYWILLKFACSLFCSWNMLGFVCLFFLYLKTCFCIFIKFLSSKEWYTNLSVEQCKSMVDIKVKNCIVTCLKVLFWIHCIWLVLFLLILLWPCYPACYLFFFFKHEIMHLCLTWQHVNTFNTSKITTEWKCVFMCLMNNKVVPLKHLRYLGYAT